jgi:hypothetical protein
MKTTSEFRFYAKLRLVAALLLLTASLRASADIYLSNLDNRWDIPGSIGDIHDLFPGGFPYGTNSIEFATGNGIYDVNAVTLEFFFDQVHPAAAPEWIDIQLFQTTDATELLLGRFGNAVPNSEPTQWPNNTKYFDFSPLQEIRLKPFSQYSLVFSMPRESPATAALLFSISSNYVAQSGWTMNATKSGNPHATGEYIKVAVDATIIPEPNVAILLIGGFIISIVWRRTFASSGQGTAV